MRLLLSIELTFPTSSDPTLPLQGYEVDDGRCNITNDDGR